MGQLFAAIDGSGDSDGCIQATEAETYCVLNASASFNDICGEICAQFTGDLDCTATSTQGSGSQGSGATCPGGAVTKDQMLSHLETYYPCDDDGTCAATQLSFSTIFDAIDAAGDSDSCI